MSDKDDKMEEVNEAFGMLLSVWSDYFDDDNPIQFFNETGPFVQNLIVKYQEAEAVARTLVQAQDTSAVEVPMTGIQENSCIQKSSQGEEHGDTELLGETSETTDSNHVSTEDKEKSSLYLHTTEGSDLDEENQTTKTGNFDAEDKTAEDGKLDVENIEELFTTSNSSDITTDSPSINVETSSALDTVSSVSRKRRFEQVSAETDDEEDEPSQKRPCFSDFLLGPLNPHLTLFGSSSTQIQLQFGTLSDNIYATTSADENLFGTNNDNVEVEEMVTEMTTDDTKMFDQSCVKSSETNVDNVVHEISASSNPVCYEAASHENDMVQDETDAVGNDTAETNVDGTDTAEQITALSETVPVSFTGDLPVTETFEIINGETNVDVAGDDAAGGAISASCDTKSDAFTFHEPSADLAVTVTLDEDRTNISGPVDVCQDLASDAFSSSEIVEPCQVPLCDTNVNGEEIVTCELNNHLLSTENELSDVCVAVPDPETVAFQNHVDDLVIPRPETPRYFPSLFGRSIKPDPTPIESPEKFNGVYRVIYKDLLDNVKSEPEEEEVMPMEVCMDEPLELVTPLRESESPDISVTPCIEHDPVAVNAIDVHNDGIINQHVSQNDQEMASIDNSFDDYSDVHESEPLDDQVVETPSHDAVVEFDATTADVPELMPSSVQADEVFPSHNEVQNDVAAAKPLDDFDDINADVSDSKPSDKNNEGDDVMDTNSFDDLSDVHESNPLNDQPVEALSYDELRNDEVVEFDETTANFSEIKPANGPVDELIPVQNEMQNNVAAEPLDDFDGNTVDVTDLKPSDDQSIDAAASQNAVQNDEVVEPLVEFDDTTADVPELMPSSEQDDEVFPSHNEAQNDTVAEPLNDVDDNTVDVTDSKPPDNNNERDDEMDTNSFDAVENGQGDSSSAPKKGIDRSRTVYIPPVQNAGDFLISGRKDGASVHHIPLFRDKSKELGQSVVSQDDIVPYAFRTSDVQVSESSAESKAAFREAVNAIPFEDHRLSMQDVVTRHVMKTDEVIVLDSDSEDEFNQLAKEIILDTDASSEDPSPVVVHPSLTKILKKHQTEGISFLYKCLIGKISEVTEKGHTGAILAHCMGLGKTLQVIAFLHTVLTHLKLRKHFRRALVLCPAGVVLNWAAEFRKWLTDLDKSLNTVRVYEISPTQKTWETRKGILKEWLNGDASVVIMSYDLFKLSFKNLEPHLLTSPGPDIVICDEAHILNKNDKTVIFEAVRKLKTLRRISLTGTPIQNNLQEYYHMVDFVTPGIIGTLRDFKKNFIDPIGAGTTKEAGETDAEIMKKRASVLWKQLDMVMNRQNFSVLSKILPKKTEHVIFVRLSEPQKKLYERYMSLRKNSNMLAQQQVFADEHTVYRIGLYPYWVKICEENGKKKKENANLGDWYSEILKAFKCTENSYETGNKLVLFLELLKWFEQLGEKTIVYTHYVEVIDVLVKLLESKAATWFADGHAAEHTKSGWSWKRDKDFYVIQGDTAAAKRHKMIQNFNDSKNKRGRLFFLSDAGAIGTNMTGATRFIVFESKHNPSKEIQAIFRAYRIGQTKPVHVYRLVAQGTMEDCIFKRQIVKQQIAARVLDNEGVSRTIERTDVDELLRFRPAPNDMDFTKQPDYAPTGDQEFDEFCLAHRDMIVEVTDHDVLIAFNEEEKLAVDVVDNEWSEHLRKSYSLQDDVFKQIQEDEGRTSLTAADEIDVGDNQQPCSSASLNIPPPLPHSSSVHRPVPSSSKVSKNSFKRPVNVYQQSVRGPFNISTPSQSSALIRQPLRRNDTPRPPPKILVHPARSSAMLPSRSSAHSVLPSRSSGNPVVPYPSSGNDMLPSRSSANFVLPSQSSGNHMVPYPSSGNDMLPSRSSANSVLPSRSSGNPVVPYPSSGNDMLPSRSSANSVLPSQSSGNHMVPYPSSGNSVLPCRSSANPMVPSRSSGNPMIASRSSGNRILTPQSSRKPVPFPRISGNALLLRPSPRLPNRDIKPVVIRPMNTPVLRPTLASSTQRPPKRQLTPEIICLDEDESTTPRPPKAAKQDAKGPSSSQSRKQEKK